MSGSSFATYARAYASDLVILAGAEVVETFARTPRTTIAFCKHCGSHVPHAQPGADEIEFGAGLLDDDPHVGITYHVHVASRAPWVVLEDDLPKHETMNAEPVGDRICPPPDVT